MVAPKMGLKWQRPSHFAARDGSNPRKLASVNGYPFRPQFSPDATRVRFTLLDRNNASTALWEVGTDGEDVTFRKKVAEHVGLGFDLPDEKPAVAPNCTQTELSSTLA